jgi:nitrate reductase delta subunit
MGPRCPRYDLLEKVGELSVEQAQEMFTRTFDINPVCTLEIGWHIYGEDYARGAFLVKMREQLREWNLRESQELPDHLTHVLALLGRLEGEAADQLAARYVLPALDKMLDGMKDSDSPYKEVLRAVSQVVGQDHDVEVVAPQQRRSSPPGWGARLPIFNAQGRAGT